MDHGPWKELSMNIPNDPVMLLSFVNTELRDNYSDFSDLCCALGLSEEEISTKLAAIDYHYDQVRHQFV